MSWIGPHPVLLITARRLFHCKITLCTVRSLTSFHLCLIAFSSLCKFAHGWRRHLYTSSCKMSQTESSKNLKCDDVILQWKRRLTAVTTEWGTNSTGRYKWRFLNQEVEIVACSLYLKGDHAHIMTSWGPIQHVFSWTMVMTDNTVFCLCILRCSTTLLSILGYSTAWQHEFLCMYQRMSAHWKHIYFGIFQLKCFIIQRQIAELCLWVTMYV